MPNNNYDNNIDDKIDDEIMDCLNLKAPKSFFLFAGAGSGKTRSLINVLNKIRIKDGLTLRMSKQRIAVITYTNAACDEIKSRINFDLLFSISTIHSFAWELINFYNNDIREWLRVNLSNEIIELNLQQSKGRTGNKASIDRAKKIEAKNKRLNRLDDIKVFSYNPNGDNLSKDSLNHSEVINICAAFIVEKPLMQKIIVQKFPVLLIDESQDTKKELIDSFFELQKKNRDCFSLGLFGDTMQRIYSDGKENLEKDLPNDWAILQKRMNHRCPKRVVKLINLIRADVDKQEQLPRSDKEEGYIRLFIAPSTSDKSKIENSASERMAEITGDILWHGSNQDIQKLTLEHHMAANRMGFLGLYAPLYKVDRLRTGLLDGTLPGLRFFTQIIFPLIQAKNKADEFEVARIVRINSPLLTTKTLSESLDQQAVIKKVNESVSSLHNLWKQNEPSLLEIVRNVYDSGLFILPEYLALIAKRTIGEQTIATNSELSDTEEEEAYRDEGIDAWDLALAEQFNCIDKYYRYISGKGNYATHQGVKGRQFPRVALIIDDEEAKGFLFSYDKLFGAKPLSDTDVNNKAEGKETSLDRTRRLFYVSCSRAQRGLAIVAYSSNPDEVEKTIINNGWFLSNEIERLV